MAGLPDISLEDTKAEVSMEDMREAMDEVLSDKDQKIIYYFFLQKDCLNIAELLANPQAQLAERGNMTMEQYVDLYTSATEMNFNVHRYPAFLSEFVRDISAPFIMIDSKGKEVGAIVKLKSRTNGHRATMVDDYQELQAVVLSKLREEKIESWIREKQKTTYVHINEDWVNCEFKYPGWIKNVQE